MSPKQVVFLGSKPIGFECLGYLISQKESLNIEITGLLTHARKEFGNSHDLNRLAHEHGIPLIEELDDLPECDILYSVQYHQIIRQEHINKAREAAVNLHMAPLPEYRGSNQFSFAIIEEKEEFGATIHRIDTRIDHGDILFQKRFPIPEKCWVNELYELTYKASLSLFSQTLSDLIKGTYTSVSQESLVATHGTSLHYRKEIANLKVIDLGWEKEKIERYIRATSMPGFEPPHCIMDGKKIFLNETYNH